MDSIKFFSCLPIFKSKTLFLTLRRNWEDSKVSYLFFIFFLVLYLIFSPATITLVQCSSSYILLIKKCSSSYILIYNHPRLSYIKTIYSLMFTIAAAIIIIKAIHLGHMSRWLIQPNEKMINPAWIKDIKYCKDDWGYNSCVHFSETGRDFSNNLTIRTSPAYNSTG